MPPERIAIVLAGGIGERFWPLSRAHRPKQLLPLAPGGRSLLADTLMRLAPLIPPSATYVVTGRPMFDPIRTAAAGLESDHVLAEPAKRNTAGAVLYAAAWLLAYRGEGVRSSSVCVLPADHRIGSSEVFREDLKRAMETVEEHGGTAVIGIAPTRPETGYGYIETAPEGPDDRGAWEVAAFREKPEADTAAEWSRSGRHYWNAGMFCWQLGGFLEELGRVSPAHGEVVRPLAAALAGEDREEVDRLFEALPDISIDYALMEKAKGVRMVPARFEWDDLGAWDALKRTEESDADGNVVRGDALLVEARDTLVVNDTDAGACTVAVVGVEGVTVVVTPDAVLVTRAGSSDALRRAVARLKEEGDLHL